MMLRILSPMVRLVFLHTFSLKPRRLFFLAQRRPASKRWPGNSVPGPVTRQSAI